MLKKRVQVRYDESDIEAGQSDWSDDADEVGDSSAAESPSGDSIAKSRGVGAVTTEQALEAPNSSSGEDETASDSGDNEEDEEDDEESDDGDVAADLETISFGALAKAQRSLKRKRNESDAGGSSGDEKLDAAKSRDPQNKAKLAEVKSQLQALSADSKSSFAESLRKAREKRREPKSTSESRSRSSKHAPMEMSSKKAVSRRRTVMELPTDTTRDPRFDRMGGEALDQQRIERNYAFLDEYRDSEIKSLRRELAKEKNPMRKEQLQKMLQPLESKQEAKQKQLDRNNILAEHKKKEREAIKQGKTPFYLKKSEQKKLVLTTQFAKMGQKQRSRVIERKRKKLTSKEKKRMPWSRRTAAPED
ncbi:hypothetical protein DRE_06231 [Drechslerella stenobrocha 248]|uniref:rRNA biogenesis protein RRP36 n=1 Tax=Drechslerella stenobrocha 248 TaxID=1043628 RepID=W7HY85_9PEZI|nr:hypothetical protein DRE_06231 [Drechslerella stenobrocha 248]